MQRNHQKRNAFTLVELLVVIAIIGLLMGLLVPVIQGVLKKGRITRIKVEVTQLDQAIESYKNTYGDYPPDFSDVAVVTRHYRKLFPKISSQDTGLLANLVLDSSDAFTGHQIDRAEALVLVLGGFSDDPVHPFTGPGGPFQLVDETATGDDLKEPVNYQYNVSRSNALFDFPTDRLTLSAPNLSAVLSPSNKYLSSDESDLGVLTHDQTSTGVDILPVFRPIGQAAPYVYFDARTYGSLSSLGFNGYLTSGVGVIRPYKSEQATLKTNNDPYGSQAAALGALEFANPDSFQVVSAGLADNFGAMVALDDTDLDTNPRYFTYPSGSVFEADPNARSPADTIGESGYQEPNVSSLEHLDNITNFSSSVLENDLP